MGLDDKEIVALSGAHTLGRAYKDRSGECRAQSPFHSLIILSLLRARSVRLLCCVVPCEAADGCVLSAASAQALRSWPRAAACSCGIERAISHAHRHYASPLRPQVAHTAAKPNQETLDVMTMSLRACSEAGDEIHEGRPWHQGRHELDAGVAQV